MSNFGSDTVEIEDEGSGLPGFEKKYKDQMRQIVTQKLDLPISTLPIMLKDQIKINPDFQRRDRWDDERQSRLIESLLMNVPIPPVFLGEDEYGFYVVLDGRQRLTAIEKFLSNNLELKNLTVWDDLNGLRYSDLVARGLDKHLTRRFVAAIALLKESSPIVKYDVFDRLNTGGVKANEMEVRNAVFRGPFTETLHNLSAVPEFCKCWEIPIDRIDARENSLYQKMIDLAVVLRFFALYEPENMDGAFKDYLGTYMEKRNKEYVVNSNLANEDREIFLRSVKNCWNIFGVDAFRNPEKRQTGPKSVPLAEAVMIGLARYSPDMITEEHKIAIRQAISGLCLDPTFSKAISTGTNGKGAILTRITAVRRVLAEILG